MQPEELQNQLRESKIREEELQAQLAELQQELEDLSYSISHDLRAPLRAIHGFVNVLQEDCQGDLDEDGQRYLSIITTSTQQITRMMEGILTLSRLSRQPINISNVAMQELVESLVSDLRLKIQDRQIEFNITPLPDAAGDPVLIRQVWAHLLSNAVKFSAPMPFAKVEVGGTIEGEETVYFIRDNGVGFDMKYEKKLFGLFQRFHTEKEFEGTGVGLAMAKRLLLRQRGRIWAKSKVNTGSTFYFSLPKLLSQTHPEREL